MNVHEVMYVFLLQDMFKAHHFKLALKKGVKHKGELTWNQYTKAVLQSLVSFFPCLPLLQARGVGAPRNFGQGTIVNHGISRDIIWRPY